MDISRGECFSFFGHPIHYRYPRTTFAPPPSSNSDPRSHSGPFSPLLTTVPTFIFIARRIQLFFPSSTRVELLIYVARDACIFCGSCWLAVVLLFIFLLPCCFPLCSQMFCCFLLCFQLFCFFSFSFQIVCSLSSFSFPRVDCGS